MRRLAWLVLGLLPATAAAETSADEAALFDRLTTREQILDAQRAAAEAFWRTGCAGGERSVLPRI
jgi:hypothetical protein